MGGQNSQLTTSIPSTLLRNNHQTNIYTPPRDRKRDDAEFFFAKTNQSPGKGGPGRGGTPPFGPRAGRGGPCPGRRGPAAPPAAAPAGRRGTAGPPAPGGEALRYVTI